MKAITLHQPWASLVAVSGTDYVLMALDDTKGPYRWPNRSQLGAMTQEQRVTCAERFIALAEKRAFPGASKPTMAMRQAADFMEYVQSMADGDDE